MSELQLSGQLVEAVKDTLVSQDPNAKDPIVSAQYLAAIIGFLVANQRIPAEGKSDILDQLCAFSKHVLHDLEGQQRAQPPPQEAFGIWKPGQS